MADDKLPEGIRFFDKKTSQPDFVIGSMVITMNDLFAFCKANPDLVTEYQGKKQLKLQILKSQKGNLYAKVDTWKPDTQQAAPAVFDAPTLPDDNDVPF